MKVELRLLMTKTSSNKNFGATSKPISKLIEKLAELEVFINMENSHIICLQCNNPKLVEIPLNTKSSIHKNIVIGYDLADDEFRIKIENYRDNSLGGVRQIRMIESGVKVCLSYNDDLLDGSYMPDNSPDKNRMEIMDRVDRVAELLENFYK